MTSQLKSVRVCLPLMVAGLILLLWSQRAYALDPVQQQIARHVVHPLSTAALLADKWDRFAVIPSARLKMENKQPVPPVAPPHDGSICTDGWRRLLFNMNPVMIQGTRFSGFRFVYDANPGDDLIFIFHNTPLGQEGRHWGIVTKQGIDVSTPNAYWLLTPNISLAYKPARTFVQGEEYLIWFSLDCDFPLQMRFRIAYGQVDAADGRDFMQMVNAMTVSAELQFDLKKPHPLAHMGVGISVVKTMEKDMPFKVTGTLRGTPAAEMSLSVGSYITHVDGQSVRDMSIEQYDAIVQDPTKDAVVLTLRRGLVDRSELNKPYDVKFTKVLIDGQLYEKLLNSPMHLRFLVLNGSNAGVAFLAGQAQEKTGNMKLAMQMYTKAAENGEVKAMAALGRVYTEGKVEVNQTQASHWYIQAAKHGDVASSIEAAHRLDTGLGTQVDLAQAATFYEQAARGGSMEASTKLGEYYTQGKGVSKDPRQAQYWLEQSAFQGNGRAAWLMGQMSLEAGNTAQAMKWFDKAIEGKSVEASIEKGKMFETGNGVKQDDVEAARWYHRVGHLNLEARYRYALILRKNNRITNPALARTQLLLAAREGYEPARKLLASDGLDWTVMKLPSEGSNDKKRSAPANSTPAKDPDLLPVL